ncbi:Hsp70 family protein [Glycomyces sp. NPDC021274]|uniref:Hsp70 family protein n=1 Tax=Glycomyces sp. NPDC021274 TaxID=3155120 RepID=UPI003409323A
MNRTSLQTPVWLAVDLGTTHTVAVVGREGAEPRSLLFDGSPLLPSGVYLDADGELHTGRDAQRLAAADPARFEPHPKRRIDDGAVLLGDREIPVEELLATGLRRVAEAAAASGQRPTGTVLTYPADWGPVRRAVLERAAAIAGFGPVRLLAEPIAAAAYCAEILGQEIAPGAAVAIFDFGGGTFDVAVVRREPGDTGRFRTLAVGGLDDLGGLDVDMALAAHLGRIIAGRDPELWQRLSEPETTADLRDRLAFWGEVRAAKEMLSRTSTAPVALPGHNPMGLHLTRDELQSLADPLVSRAVDETRRTVERAGVDPGELTALLLVGGSSRMPLVATRLHARLGIAPAVPEQPELPVAFGALRFSVTGQDEAVSSPPATPPAGEPGPLHYAPYPVVGPQTPAPSPFTAPSPPPTGTQPPPMQTPAGTLPPRSDFTPQEPLRLTFRDRPRLPPPFRRHVMSVLAGSVAIVVTAAVIILTQIDWDGTAGDLTDGIIGGVEDLGETGPELVSVYEQQLSTTGTAAVTASENIAFIAEVTTGSTVVRAIAANGDALWTNEYELEPDELHMMVVGGLLVLDARYSATDEGKTMRAVAHADTGELLWKQPWENRNDVAFYGTDVIVEQRDGFEDNAVIRIDLTTGGEVWREKGPESLYTIDDHRIRTATAWDERAEDPVGEVPPNSYSLYDNLVATDQIVDLDPEAGTGVVRDAATGDQTAEGVLGIDDDLWTVFDGLVIGRASDAVSPGRDTLIAYALIDFSVAWSIPLDAPVSIQQVKPCGPHLVCTAVDHSESDDQYRTFAVNTETAEEMWEVKVDWAFEDGWYASPEGLVFGDQSFDTVADAQILDFDGKVLREADDATVMAFRDGQAVIETVASGLSGATFQISVLDMADGARSATVDVGDGVPEQAALAGNLLVVLTGDYNAMVLTVPEL